MLSGRGLMFRRSLSTVTGAATALWVTDMPGTALTPGQVTQVLMRNCITFKGPKDCFISHSHFNSVPSNDPMEDTHSESFFKHGAIVGVYDGHSGTECSAVLESYLSAYVAKEIQDLHPANSKEERIKSVSLAIQNAFTRLDSDILEGRISSIDMPSSSWFSWWTNQKVDTALIIKNLRNAMAGSCALLAYLEGKQLYVACTGDSRAVLGTRGLNGSFSAMEMSVDQTTKNSKEYNRIMQEHPGEEKTVIQRGRVLGGLMPTRAFGDARYKWSKDTQWVLSEYGCRKPSPILKTPPYVTACPMVTTVELNPETDPFLILATDGLWDEISSEDAVDLVAKYKNETHVATELIKEALSKGDESRLERILGIPAGISRKFRDDITVNVLFFGESKLIETNPIYGDILLDFKEIDFKKAGLKRETLSIWIQNLRDSLNQRAKL